MSADSTINPESVLKELSELWVTLAKPAESENGGAHSGAHVEESGVLRACAMTLITLADERDDPMEIGETVAALMREHPSRTILIRMRECADRVLASRVYAQCWMPFGGRRQICCEQIEITASDSALDDLPAVLLPLTAADLPVILWCRSRRLFDTPGFAALAGLAQRVIVDSAPGGPGRQTLPQVVSLQKRGQAGRFGIADLAWTRLTSVREVIAQIFENPQRRAALRTVTRVRIAHLSERPRSGACYLAAWLLNAIEKLSGTKPELLWERASIEGGRTGIGFAGLSIEGSGEEGVPDGGPHKEAPLAQAWVESRSELGLTVTVCAGGQETPTHFPAPTDYRLLAEELSLPFSDPVFQASLTRAVEIAEGEKNP